MKIDELLTSILEPNQLTQKALRRQAINAIYEGLIKSYAKETVIAWVHDKHCQVIKTDYNFFIIKAKQKEIDPPEILRMINLGGWFISKIEFNSGANVVNKNIDKDSFYEYESEYIIFRVEAKYDVELESNKFPKILYCLAPNVKSIVEKIKEIGLIPKSGPNLDNTPARIYLAKYKDALIYEMLPDLKQNNKHYFDGAVLITIDTSKFPDNVRLFIDEHWKNRAYYTIVNIPKYCITSIEEIND